MENIYSPYSWYETFVMDKPGIKFTQFPSHLKNNPHHWRTSWYLSEYEKVWQRICLGKWKKSWKILECWPSTEAVLPWGLVEKRLKHYWSSWFVLFRRACNLGWTDSERNVILILILNRKIRIVKSLIFNLFSFQLFPFFNLQNFLI